MDTTSPKQKYLTIDEMYAFVASDETGEGIMGGQTIINGQPMMLPLVGADMSRITSLYKMAEQISRASGKPFKVLKFTQREDITDFVKDSLRNN